MALLYFIHRLFNVDCRAASCCRDVRVGPRARNCGGPLRRHNRRTVGGRTSLSDRGSSIRQDVLEGETVDVPLVRNEIQLELMPCFAGCTKQKLPTTSMIQNSLSPRGRFHDLLVVGNSIRVVYFTFGAYGNDVLRVN